MIEPKLVRCATGCEFMSNCQGYSVTDKMWYCLIAQKPIVIEEVVEEDL